MLKEIGDAVEKVSGVKLRGGIFGNVCVVLITLIVVLGVAAAITRNIYVVGGTIVLLLGVSWRLLSRIIKFAEENPAAAILEGAQYVERERFMIASKGHPATIVHLTDLAQANAEPLLGGAPRRLLDAEQAAAAPAAGTDEAETP
jgi:hypothetical protein